MEIFRLVLAHPQHPEKPRLVAEHLDPALLKQRGYEIARNLGDQAAIWATEAPAQKPVLALRCRTGHALSIIAA